MLIFCDERLPSEVKNKLSRYGYLVEFATRGIVDDVISGHPDIFIHRIGSKVIYAPNTPKKYVEALQQSGCETIEGGTVVSTDIKTNYAYNVVSGQDFLVGRIKYVDPVVLEQSIGKKFIDVGQGFSACSCVNLDGKIITSDLGIHRKILGSKYFAPNGIVLPGVKNGFLGGCAGIYERKIFLTGSLNQHADGETFRESAMLLGFEIVELSRERLFDGGGIICL